MPVFEITLVEDDDKIKVVDQNLLLPLFSAPSDHTNVSDVEFVVDQTVNPHGIIAVNAVISHVQNVSAYSRAQVKSLFQQGLQLQLLLSSVKSRVI